METSAIFDDEFAPSNRSSRLRRQAPSKTAHDADLISQTVYVLDADEDSVNPPERQLCLSTRIVANSLSALIFITVSTAIASLLIVLRRRRRLQDKIFYDNSIDS